MEEERVWLIEATILTKDNVEDLIEELKSKGFEVKKKEIIFDLD